MSPGPPFCPMSPSFPPLPPPFPPFPIPSDDDLLHRHPPPLRLLSLHPSSFLRNLLFLLFHHTTFVRLLGVGGLSDLLRTPLRTSSSFRRQYYLPLPRVSLNTPRPSTRRPGSSPVTVMTTPCRSVGRFMWCAWYPRVPEKGLLPHRRKVVDPFLPSLLPFLSPVLPLLLSSNPLRDLVFQVPPIRVPSSFGSPHLPVFLPPLLSLLRKAWSSTFTTDPTPVNDVLILVDRDESDF